MRDVSLEVLFLIKAETCGVSKKYLKSNEQLEHWDQVLILFGIFFWSSAPLGLSHSCFALAFSLSKLGPTSKMTTRRRKSRGNCRGVRSTRPVSPNETEITEIWFSKACCSGPTLEKIRKVWSLTRLQYLSFWFSARGSTISFLTFYLDSSDQII